MASDAFQRPTWGTDSQREFVSRPRPERARQKQLEAACRLLSHQSWAGSCGSR